MNEPSMNSSIKKGSLQMKARELKKRTTFKLVVNSFLVALSLPTLGNYCSGTKGTKILAEQMQLIFINSALPDIYFK